MRPCPPDERGNESSPSSLHARESTIGLGFGRGENHLFMPFPARCTEQPTTQFTVRRQRLFGEQSPVSLLYHSVGGFLKLSFYQWLYYLRSSNHLCQVIKYSIDTVFFMRNEIYLPKYVAQEILSSGKYSLATVLFVFLNFFWDPSRKRKRDESPFRPLPPPLMILLPLSPLLLLNWNRQRVQ